MRMWQTIAREQHTFTNAHQSMLLATFANHRASRCLNRAQRASGYKSRRHVYLKSVQQHHCSELMGVTCIVELALRHSYSLLNYGMGAPVCSPGAADVVQEELRGNSIDGECECKALRNDHRKHTCKHTLPAQGHDRKMNSSSFALQADMHRKVCQASEV